jgi:pilus assembly protein CpaE
MNNLANEKFDFDGEGFSKEELAELESLTDEELDLELEDFDFEDIDLDNLDVESWDAPEANLDAAPEEAPVEDVPVAEAFSSEPEVDEDPFADDAFAELDAIDTAPELEGGDDVPPEAELDAAPVEAPAVVEETAEPALPEADIPSVEAAAVAAGVAPQAEEEFLDDFADEPQEGDHVPVPRINIDFFCETDRVTRMAELSAADRRLAKAHVTILSGGIAKAVEHYANQSTPNLIILETVDGGSALFEGLEGLASVCDPSTQVIIVGGINDINLYRELMNRGISEYLISPKSPMQITRAISNLYNDPSASPIGRNIVFVGARGGVGSSTICHNVAWAMAEKYKSDSVILDLDLAFGTASLDFEQDPSQGLAEALSAPERLDDVLLDRLLQRCTDRLSLFAAPNMLDRDYDLPSDSFTEVMDIVRKAAPNIIIDLPHVWTAWSRNILQSADEIVITATPDLASFRNAKNLVETIKQARVNDNPPYLVINQADVPKRPEIPVEQFTEALGIEPTAVISWDPNLFGTAATNAETVLETNDKAKPSLAMDQLAALLLGQSADMGAKKGFDLKSLIKF